MLTSASSCKTMRVIWAPCRITPACAGNRVETSHAPPPKKNHPRLRGEQSPGGYITYPGEGSPPLARGTGGGTPNILHISGITPACAGNRCGQRICPQSARDHPRLRGEQTFSNIEQQSAEGSPPLARGTAPYLTSVLTRGGITPACAGNRLLRRTAWHGCQDHPRLRGEQITETLRDGDFVGSPPLARGTACG